jgi:hypothetical protein
MRVCKDQFSDWNGKLKGRHKGRRFRPGLDYHYHKQERFLTNKYSVSALPWVTPAASKAFARCSGLP